MKYLIGIGACATDIDNEKETALIEATEKGIGLYKFLIKNDLNSLDRDINGYKSFLKAPRK